MTIVSLDLQDGTTRRSRFSFRRKKIIIPILTVIIIVIAFVIYWLTRSNYPEIDHPSLNVNPPNPHDPLPPSPSKLHQYENGAVSSDSEICSNIGRDILQKEGSAVDATIATMFCNGLVTMQSMGIGGGFLMTIYHKETNKSFVLNAREKAPLMSKEDMFVDAPEKTKAGALAVAVPGELKGYIEAHKRFGKLQWEELIKPTINLCNIGFNMSTHQFNTLKRSEKKIRNNSVLKELFVDPDGELKPLGSTIEPKQLCKTLEIIAKDPESFYNGTLGDIIVQDIKELGGIITKEDLLKYQTRWEEPVMVKLKDNTFHSVPAPGGGNIVGLILNVLQGYNFGPLDLHGIDPAIETYQKILETFKHGFAKRSFLGDPNFVNITQLLQNITSNDLAIIIRNKIKNNETSNDPTYYGAMEASKDDHGTAHISVLAPNGDAVSVTSTVNFYYGAMTSKNTGIILNSAMDDFSSPGFVNYFGLPYSPANKIEPEKRPMSSMSPSIVTDADNNVKLVVGAAGGTKIISGVSLVIMKCLWFGKSLKEAIDDARVHHQVFPMEVQYEYGFLLQILYRLEEFGHKTNRTKDFSVVNAILKERGVVWANADYRKGGETSGL